MRTPARLADGCTETLSFKLDIVTLVKPNPVLNPLPAPYADSCPSSPRPNAAAVRCCLALPGLCRPRRPTTPQPTAPAKPPPAATNAAPAAAGDSPSPSSSFPTYSPEGKDPFFPQSTRLPNPVGHRRRPTNAPAVRRAVDCVSKAFPARPTTAWPSSTPAPSPSAKKAKSPPARAAPASAVSKSRTIPSWSWSTVSSEPCACAPAADPCDSSCTIRGRECCLSAPDCGLAYELERASRAAILQSRSNF